MTASVEPNSKCRLVPVESGGQLCTACGVWFPVDDQARVVVGVPGKGTQVVPRASLPFGELPVEVGEVCWLAFCSERSAPPLTSREVRDARLTLQNGGTVFRDLDLQECGDTLTTVIRSLEALEARLIAEELR